MQRTQGSYGGSEGNKHEHARYVSFLKILRLNDRSNSRRVTAKNWFDSEEDIGDAKSLHSSDASTLTPHDDEPAPSSRHLEPIQPQFGARGSTRTEITSDANRGDAEAGWAHQVRVSRQVIIQTSEV